MKVVRSEIPTPPVVDFLKEKAKTMVTPREEPSKLDGAGNRTIVEVMSKTGIKMTFFLKRYFYLRKNKFEDTKRVIKSGESKKWCQ